MWKIICQYVLYRTAPSLLEKELEDEVVARQTKKQKMEDQMPEYLLKHRSFSFKEGAGG